MVPAVNGALGSTGLRTGSRVLLLQVWPHASHAGATSNAIRNSDSQACPEALSGTMHLSWFPSEQPAFEGRGSVL